MRLPSIIVAAAALAIVLSLGAGQRASVSAAAILRAPDGPARLPAGAEGELIAYGQRIIQHTPALMGGYVTAAMSCEACHLNAGTKAHAGSFVGVYAKFPQWNKRAGRFITLQDRLAECFLYSMNGRPPAYTSREMIALTAYIAYLSRGTAVGVGSPAQGFIPVVAAQTPNPGRGANVYSVRCSACHGANGAGNGAFPPLWGAKSFNGGAGMHRLATMAAFVRYNMPYGAPPNTLTSQQAIDVSAFVLAHPRPVFNRNRPIAFPAQPASFY